MSALKKRVVSSIIVIGIVFVSIMVDWLLGVVTTIFIVMGLYEFFAMLDHKGIKAYKYFGLTVGAIIPLSLILRFETTKNWELFFIVLVLVFLFVMQFMRRQNSGAVVGIATTIFGILYISWFLSFLIKIRYLNAGAGLLSTVLLITKLGDIGAYLIGTRFGKTPLVPRISPKKSVEGAIGGLAFSILGALVSKPFLGVTYVHLACIGVALGLLAQLGDLSESLLKRDCGVKDSGNLVPGMGGALDLLDSLIFTAPTFYFYMSAVLK